MFNHFTGEQTRIDREKKIKKRKAKRKELTQKNSYRGKKVLLGFEPRSSESESEVITTTL